MDTHLTETTKHVVDTLSLATVLATITAWLPPVAAFISIIWGLIRIFETRTVQSILSNNRRRNRGRNTGFKERA